MRRRAFLRRCGMLAVGSVALATLTQAGHPLWAVDGSANGARQMMPSDRTLLRVLSAYSTDAYFWGSQVFARATGVRAVGATTNLLVRVGDYSKLVAFLRSGPVKTLGKITVANNTLSFTYQGTAYTVTNEGSEGFSRAVAAGGVTRSHVAGVGVFAHETMLYHPATDTLHDPSLAAEGRKLDLVTMPVGGMSPRMQTLLRGWLQARLLGLDFGGSFQTFQDDLLNSEPTEETASKVVLALLDHLPQLAGVYSVEELRPLLLSPLVSISLQTVLGVDVKQVIADVEAMRADASRSSYPDAAIWLAVLLPSQIAAGTVDEWLDLSGDDEASNAANRAALPLARQLVKMSTAAGR